MAGFAFAAVAHRFDAAGGFLGGGERFLLLRRGGVEGRGGDLAAVAAAGVAGVLAAVLAFFDRAAHFLLHGDGGFLDVGGAEAAEVVGGYYLRKNCNFRRR